MVTSVDSGFTEGFTDGAAANPVSGTTSSSSALPPQAKRAKRMNLMVNDITTEPTDKRRKTTGRSGDMTDRKVDENADVDETTDDCDA